MPIINGTSGPDILRGAGELHGLEGNDQIEGSSGPDFITGDGGNDNLQGYDGADTIDGGDGNDQLNGGSGDDRLSGGAGNDYLILSPFFTDSNTLFRAHLDGGDGDDTIYIGGTYDVTVIGGAGSDTISAVYHESGTIDAGAGADRVSIEAFQTSLTITLGSGADALYIYVDRVTPAGPRMAVVTDFSATDDTVMSVTAITDNMTRWNGSNPFSSGHLALVQSGADVLLRFDRDGGGDGYLDLVRFANVQRALFAATTFFGYLPDGSPPPGQTLSGTAGDDYFLDGGIGGDSISGGAGRDVITAAGGDDTLDGGAGDDVLYGQAGSDVLHGGSGDDTMQGWERDQLFGDDGNDVLQTDYMPTTLGAATLDGGGGADELIVNFTAGDGSTVVGRGGDGADSIRVTGRGAAILDGGAGDDAFLLSGSDGAAITMGAGVDTLRFDAKETAPSRAVVLDFQAGVGGDRLSLTDYLESVATTWDRNSNPIGAGYLRLLASGSDTVVQVNAGSGWRDLAVLRNVPAGTLVAENISGYALDGGRSPGLSLDGGFGPETLSGGVGPDTISGAGGDDSLSGGAEDDLLSGGNSADTLSGSYGSDTLDGGAGGDCITGGAGIDLIHGGDGDDWIDERNATSDRLYGDAGRDTFFVSRTAAGGELLVDLGEGDDNLYYSPSAPGFATVLGGAGNDQISLAGFFTAGVDRVLVDAGDGADRVRLDGVGAFEVRLGAGSDTISTGSTLTYGVSRGSPAGVVLDFNIAEDRIGSGFGRLGQDGGDTVLQVADSIAPDSWLTVVRLLNVNVAALTASNLEFGVRVDPWRLGTIGNDQLSTGSGITRVDGGDGDDIIAGESSDDYLRGSRGADTLVGGAGADSLDGGAGDDNVAGGDGADSITELSGSNYLRGDLGDDVITGGSGFDDINGNMGDDTAAGGGGDDWVVGGRDDDWLDGGAGDDIVYGNLGDDTCSGSEGADLVRGGQGNDLLLGSYGNDWLSGDRGDDTLSGGLGADIFHTFGDAGIDRVADFSLAQGDRVQLDPGTLYAVAQIGADTVITMVGGGQMVLVGVSVSALTGQWIFGG